MLVIRWKRLQLVKKTQAITLLPQSLQGLSARTTLFAALTEPLAEHVRHAKGEALQCEYLFELCVTVASVPYFLLAASTTGFRAVPIWSMAILPALSVRSVLRQVEMSKTSLLQLFSTHWFSVLSGLPAAFDGPSHVMGSINMWCRLTLTMHHRMEVAFGMTATGSKVFPFVKLAGLPWMGAAIMCLAFVQQLVLSLHYPEVAAKLVGMDAMCDDEPETVTRQGRYILTPPALLPPGDQLFTRLAIFSCQQVAENLPTLELQTTFLLAEGCGLGQDPVGAISMLVAMAMAVRSCLKASTKTGLDIEYLVVQVFLQSFLILPTLGVISHCLAKMWALQTCPSAEWGVSSGCVPLCSSVTNGTTCLPDPAC